MTTSVTDLLLDWREGDAGAFDRLVSLVYDELRRQARRQLRNERSNHTLETTALVHEAFLKLVDARRVSWQDRGHFLAVAARAMRRILVSHARRHRADKRGGGAVNLALGAEVADLPHRRAEEMVALDEALERLSAFDERLGRTVELRFFGGLSIEETAEVLGTSRNTVKRDWIKAKAWLYQALARP